MTFRDLHLQPDQDLLSIQSALVVSGIPHGREAHGVYWPDGRAVLNGTQFHGDQRIGGHAPPSFRQDVTEFLPGDYVYGGCVFGHFGHMLLETFARLAVFFSTDKRVLFSSLNMTRNSLFWKFVKATGLPADRITVVDHPVIVENLFVPAPDFKIRSSINIAFIRAFEALGQHIESQNGIQQNSNTRPAYLSRSRTSKTGRHYFGETIIDTLLADHGQDIIFMESMDISGQIEQALTRTRLTGFWGTAFHHLLFSQRPKTTTYLKTRWINPNFRLIESLKLNHSSEVVVDIAANASSRFESGPFLLSRYGIATAIRAAGVSISEDDIDPVIYSRCVEEFEAVAAQIRACVHP